MIVGKVKPGDMGFDVIHMKLNKTFSTPQGGGGTGAGPVGVNERWLPFLPVPIVERNKDGSYYLLTEKDKPQTIGRLSAHLGNAGVLLRAYIYARLLGREGMQRVAEFSTLNANYMLAELKKRGFDLAFPKRRATHEFIVTLKKLKDETGISAMDFAKRLLDKGYHAPTTYFPLLVPECFLIEPTETETREELDGFIKAMEDIAHEARTTPDVVKGAPHTLPVKRLDDVKAARELDLTWKRFLIAGWGLPHLHRGRFSRFAESVCRYVADRRASQSVSGSAHDQYMDTIMVRMVVSSAGRRPGRGSRRCAVPARRSAA